MHRRSIHVQGRSPFNRKFMRSLYLSGFSTRFQALSRAHGQVTYVLLTRSPLTSRKASFPLGPFDLHVLGMPPAFILSQDQTLHLLIFFLTLARLVSLFALLIPYSELTFPVQFSKIDSLASRLLRSALVYITILSLFRQAFFCSFLPFFVFLIKREHSHDLGHAPVGQLCFITLL